MEISIKSGNNEVIGSGSVICLKDTPVSFIIGGLNYQFNIYRDEKCDEKGRTMNVHIEDGVAKIGFYTKDSMSFASKSPYQLGRYKGKAILFSFSLDLLPLVASDDFPIVMNYTWMLGDEIGELSESESNGEE